METADADGVPFALIDTPPVFIVDGMSVKFSQWVQENVKYPIEGLGRGLRGRVIYTITVGTDGSIENLEFLTSPGRAFTREVARVISSAPKWSPGAQRGRPVRVMMQGYVDFVL